MLAPIWDGIPASLRAIPQWVAWELRWRTDNASWAKVPLNVRGVSAAHGYAKARSNKSADWTTFDAVRAAWDRSYGTYTPANPDGPGFMFRADGGLVGIDGDKCRDRVTGELSPFGTELMRRFPGYWEVSPSGTGIKGVFFGQLPEGKGRKVDFPDGHGVELYDRLRYFAITGRRLDGAAEDLTSCADQLPAYLAELDAIRGERQKEKERVRAERSPRPTFVPPTDRTIDDSEKVRRARAYVMCREEAVARQRGDDRTFGTACRLVIGFDLTPAQAMPIMREWNETCSPPWPDEWLWRKVTQADLKPDPRGELLYTQRSGFPTGYLNLSAAEIDALVGRIGKPPAPPVADQVVADLGARIATGIATQAPTAPEATPDECALYAAHDIAEEVSHLRTRCPQMRPVLMEKEGRPFVCDRPCGNGTTCRACLDARHVKKTREGNDYLVRTSVVADADAPRAVYAALVDSSIKPGSTRWNTLTKKVGDRGGERCSLLTEDAQGVAAKLGRDPGVSGFFLEDNKAQEESRLWLLSLPNDAGETVLIGGITFRRAPVANAMRAWFHAVKTVPKAVAEEGTFKPHHQSAGWGDEEPKIPTTVKALRPSKFSVQRTAKILDSLQIESYAVRFDTRRSADPGLGWVLPDVRSLAMTLWLGGVDADFTPTVDRVVDLARFWLPLLPADLGKGRRVENLLRQHIWHQTLYDISGQLREADAHDKAEEEARAEASELYAALRQSFSGRESEATGLLADLLA
ncbi:MAG TPA: hypothetical protein VGE74_18565 [Gemmata sp.]